MNVQVPDMLAASDYIADAILAGIGRDLRAASGHDLQTLRACAVDAARLVGEGWHDGPETFRAVRDVALETGVFSTDQVSSILAFAFVDYLPPDEIASIGAISPADDFRNVARRRMSTAVNGDRLAMLQSIALDCSAAVKAGTLENYDAGDLLHELAEASGLTAELRADDVQHIISEGLKGRSTIAKDRPAYANGHAAGAPAPTAASTERLRESNSRPATDWRRGAILASNLQTMTFAPVRYVLPGFIPEGVTILGAKPKAGKSWMALDLAIAVAMGRYTLGTLKPAHGDVMYGALEDSPRRLKRRMQKLLPHGTSWPERLTLHAEWRRVSDGGLADIEEWCDSVAQPTLVILDTFEKIRPIQNGKSQAYSADYDALTGLQKIASKRGIAILLLHHVRKMEADDPFDTISGTLGLTGAADTILVLKRQSGSTTMFARGRDIEESETAIQFDRSSCKWTMLGAASEVHRSNERAAIIKALSAAGGALSVAEIMVATESHSRGAIDTLLFKMTQGGEIERIKRGVYALRKETGKIGQKESIGSQTTEITDETDNLTNLTDLSISEILRPAKGSA